MRRTIALFSIITTLSSPALSYAQTVQPEPPHRLLPNEITFDTMNLNSPMKEYGPTYTPPTNTLHLGPFVGQSVWVNRKVGPNGEMKPHQSFEFLHDFGNGKSFGFMGNGIGGSVKF